jgi:16S rRNA (adenine1518-N6/adenine1519-N6)-dimethyltransferase
LVECCRKNEFEEASVTNNLSFKSFGPADLLPDVLNLLNRYDIIPKRRLSQNFVIVSDLLERMISYASISERDTVLEVGAGLGFLTRLLSEVSGKVIAVEVDPRLIAVLRDHVSHLANIALIKGDILKVIIPCFDKVVSAPPYSISSKLLLWLLERTFDRAILLLQREFANRLVASVGSRNYGFLTLTMNYLFKIDCIDHVSRKTFYPSPSVDSVVVRLISKEPSFYVENRRILFWLIKVLFTQRNKKGRNVVSSVLQKKGLKKKEAIEFADSHHFLNKRISELTIRDFGNLAHSLYQKNKKILCHNLS